MPAQSDLATRLPSLNIPRMASHSGPRPAAAALIGSPTSSPAWDLRFGKAATIRRANLRGEDDSPRSWRRLAPLSSSGEPPAADEGGPVQARSPLAPVSISVLARQAPRSRLGGATGTGERTLSCNSSDAAPAELSRALSVRFGLHCAKGAQEGGYISDASEADSEDEEAPTTGGSGSQARTPLLFKHESRASSQVRPPLSHAPCTQCAAPATSPPASPPPLYLASTIF
jgi:hypothetical protein